MCRVVFSIVCIFFVFSANGQEFPKISSFKEIKIQDFSPQTLVVTDINDTLVSCEEAVYQKETIKILPPDLSSKIKSFRSEEKNYLANLIITKCKNRAIGNSVEFMLSLRKQNISHIALTAAFGSSFKGLDMKKYIVSDLKRLGINFQQNFFPHESVEFTNLVHDPVSLSFPVFYQEISFTSGAANQKGTVLKSLLEKAKENPDKVIFVDDSSEHLTSVAAAMLEKKIPVVLYQFVPQIAGLSTLQAEDLEVWRNLIADVESRFSVANSR